MLNPLPSFSHFIPSTKKGFSSCIYSPLSSLKRRASNFSFSSFSSLSFLLLSSCSCFPFLHFSRSSHFAIQPVQPMGPKPNISSSSPTKNAVPMPTESSVPHQQQLVFFLFFILSPFSAARSRVFGVYILPPDALDTPDR